MGFLAEKLMNYIDSAFENVKGHADSERPTARIQEATGEVLNKGKKITEKEYNAICLKYRVDPDNLEVIIEGRRKIFEQRDAIRKHILEKRSITNNAIIKKYRCYRPDARMNELREIWKITFNRRVVNVMQLCAALCCACGKVAYRCCYALARLIKREF
jgi:hypothetical protein